MRSTFIFAILFIIIATGALFVVIERARHSEDISLQAAEMEHKNRAFVEGRLYINRQYGLTHYAMLAGVICPSHLDPSQSAHALYESPSCGDNSRTNASVYVPYRLNHGGQLIALSFLDTWQRERQSSDHIALMSLIHRLIFALLMALYLGWIYCELNRFGAIVALCALCFTTPIFAASNVFLPLYALFIPLVASAWLLFLYRRRAISTRRMWFGYSALLVYSYLVAGYAFAIPSLLAAFMPLVYYAAVDRWPWKRFLHTLIIMKVSMVASLALGFAILILQNGLADGNIGALFRDMGTALFTNPYNSSDLYSSTFARSLVVTRSTVLNLFLDTSIFTLDIPLILGNIPISMRTLLGVAIAISLCIGFAHALAGHGIRLPRRLHSILNYKLLCYSIAALFSIIPPLLYIIIAKRFSFRALPSALLVWLLPTFPLIMSYYGYTIHRIIILLVAPRRR